MLQVVVWWFFEHFIDCQVKKDTDLFIIDEVGKMELFSSSFFPAVLRILESNVPVLASIPILKIGRDIPAGTSLTDTSLKHQTFVKNHFQFA